jgi:hypothetical protein
MLQRLGHVVQLPRAFLKLGHVAEGDSLHLGAAAAAVAPQAQ